MQNPIPVESAWAARPIPYPVRRLAAMGEVPAIRRPARLRVGLLMLALGLFGFLSGCAADEESAEDAAATAATAAEVARIQAGAETASAKAEEESAPVIVFLGTSLTAGYGLEESQAYPALIQGLIDEAGLDYRVINAGVSGDTSAGGLRRLSWLLRLPVSVLVLELGANDMLRGQGVEQLERNLVAILDQTAEAHPGVRFVISGMRAAPNLGREYGDRFDAIYPGLAKRYNAAFVPFLLEDVAARRNLNQADGIHPTAEGHELVAARVWKTLEPVLR